MSCSSWTSRSSSEASFGIGVSLRCVLRASAQNYPGYAVPLRVLRHLHTSLRRCSLAFEFIGERKILARELHRGVTLRMAILASLRTDAQGPAECTPAASIG